MTFQRLVQNVNYQIKRFNRSFTTTKTCYEKSEGIDKSGTITATLNIYKSSKSFEANELHEYPNLARNITEPLKTLAQLRKSSTEEPELEDMKRILKLTRRISIKAHNADVGTIK